MNEHIYQHFRKEEQAFIDTATGWIRQCEDQYSPYLTDFLDPRQVMILESLVGKNGDLKLLAFGGYELAERKRLFIYPAYYQVTQDDFEIDILEIKYPVKFATLTHSKILGTLMSVGVKREVFGDIITDGVRWQFFVNRQMQHYVEQQLDKIGKVSVKLEPCTYLDVIIPIDEWVPLLETASSLRVDAIISTVFKISRQRAKSLIEAGKVKVNYAEMLRPDFELELLDMISVRGFGRIYLEAIDGKTKKEKFRLQFKVLSI